MIVEPGATEAGTVNMKSLMVTAAVADEPPDVADDVAGPGAAEDGAAAGGAADDVGELAVDGLAVDELAVDELAAGGEFVAVVEDVDAVAAGVGVVPPQALSVNASPLRASAARRMV